MFLRAVLISWSWLLLPTTLAIEYYGIGLGSLQGEGIISGTVWLANATALQITDLRIEPTQKQELVFAFASSDDTKAASAMYKVEVDGYGEEYLVQMYANHLEWKHLSNEEIGGQRIVVIVPEKSIREWKHFGTAAGKTMKFLAELPIDKSPPEPYCCLRHAEQLNKGIIGDHYSAGTGPIFIENSKTIVLRKLTLEANRAPDAWVFAGKGEVRQSTGKKAYVIGRDTPSRHCSLRNEYKGDEDLRVRLAGEQNIYELDYLSLFCYQYDVDFGHILVNLDPKINPVPAYIPNQQIKTRQGEELEVLESNVSKPKYVHFTTKKCLDF